MSGDDLLTLAGVGGIVGCCLALELLGGVALVSGLAAASGLSNGILYAAIVGLSGLLAVVLAVGYREFDGVAS